VLKRIFGGLDSWHLEYNSRFELDLRFAHWNRQKVS
jgi:hypothetical protein